ncbi:MAG: YicC family protein [Lachnospiraceae bacterium]|nr:YicC family protein [Lachnospiraceae bacterium]
MIKSMTGFGRFEVSEQNKKITVEMKSVNHRYLDVSVRMPKQLNSFDAVIRAEIKKYASRGKVDVYISYEDTSEDMTSLKYNSELATEYVSYYKSISEQFGIENDISTSKLMRCPEVLVMEENQTDEDELWKMVQKAVDGACEKFVESRLSEGAHLKNDLLAKLDGMMNIVESIAVRSPEVFEEYRVNIRKQVEELLGNTQIDESRIATEVVLFADKMCIDEELVRLRSHVEKMKSDLMTGEDVGRKLDFLAQEMNREANTILSKANDLEVTNRGIDLKTEIEKIREQIQNVE